LCHVGKVRVPIRLKGERERQKWTKSTRAYILITEDDGEILLKQPIDPIKKRISRGNGRF